MKGLTKIPDLTHLLKILGINGVLIGVLLEGICLGFYGWQHQQLYYTRSSGHAVDRGPEGINLDQQGIRLEQNVTEVLHPFLGYISQPGIGFGGFEFQATFRANNYGLVSQFDYPYKRQNSDQVLVGIFGGSVATFYYMNEMENPTLARTLKTIPEFANKEIVLLNFAQGGYKQPQQLLALNYFLSQGQELDLVINIDGFNEVAIARLNWKHKIGLSMPSPLQVIPLIQLVNNNLSTEQMRIMLEVIKLKDSLKKALVAQQNCTLALCYFFQEITSRLLIQAYYSNLENFESKRKTNLNPDASLVYLQAISQQELDHPYEQMANLWVNSSLAMHHVLSQRSIPYFHVLQPNQYYQTERELSVEEAEKFSPEKNTRNPYIEGVQVGYPYLIKKSKILAEKGVKFLNGVTALDQETRTVYIDTCCHYNQTGRNIFANYIASQILADLSQDNSHDSISIKVKLDQNSID